MKLEDPTSKVTFITPDGKEYGIFPVDNKGPQYWIPEKGEVTEEEFKAHRREQYKKYISKKFMEFCANEIGDCFNDVDRMNRNLQKIISIINESRFEVNKTICKEKETK